MEKSNFDSNLRIEVEKIFGKKVIDKWDCEVLSKSIFSEIKKNISYQTLRRFWNLAYSKSSVSIQSKNILAQYAGYNDFENFKTIISKNTSTDLDWSFIKNWSKINPYDSPLEDSIYWHDKLSQSFASFILSNEEVFESFSKSTHNNEVILKYIISYHPMYDNLAKDWYLRGLNLYFRNNQELHYYLFVANIRYMSSVFTESKVNISSIANQIETFLPKIRKKYGVIWSLEARSLSALLHYYSSKKNITKLQELKNEIFDFIEINKNKTFEIDNYRIFLFLVCDLLNIYGFYELSYQLQMKYNFLDASPSPLWKNGYEEASKIVKCFSLFKNNELEESIKIFKTIDLSRLNFDFKKYFTIQYYILELGFCSENQKNKKIKIENCLEKIICETELKYFNTLQLK